MYMCTYVCMYIHIYTYIMIIINTVIKTNTRSHPLRLCVRVRWSRPISGYYYYYYSYICTYISIHRVYNIHS